MPRGARPEWRGISHSFGLGEPNYPFTRLNWREPRSGGMAYAADSKSAARKGMRVRLPPPGPDAFHPPSQGVANHL